MPSPKDLPGFYFDSEKNRYFPIRGPIPGSKRHSSSSAGLGNQTSDPEKKHSVHRACRRMQVKAFELLHDREVQGRRPISNKRRYNFEHEYQKLKASHPVVWKYSCIGCVADSALEQLYGFIQTPSGLKGTDLLAAGSTNGGISLYSYGNIGQAINDGMKCAPELACTHIIGYETSNYNSIGSIWNSTQASASYPSKISQIQSIGKHSPDATDDVSSFRNALVATLGSGVSGGSVYILNVSEPLDFTPGVPSLHRRISRLASTDCTIWTADCNYSGTQAVIGTDFGAALINLETRGLSWVYRSQSDRVYRNKSDIFSQQFDQSGNIVLCGFRNGAIIPIDIRQKQSQYSTTSAIPPATTTPSIQKSFHVATSRHERTNKWKSKVDSSNVVFMSSAVCSLVALQSDDQYFVGGSMDGSINLFDHRLLKRGAIQSYEGNVNSHSHLQLGVDPSETLLISGGEDCFVRIWSINSGELLFRDNVSNVVMPTICWPRIGNSSHGMGLHGLTHSLGLWLGSREGIFYLHGT